MIRRREFAEPIRPDVTCRHCGEDLEAVADLIDELGGIPAPRLEWTVQFVWRHVAGGKATCTVTHRHLAAPGDAREAFLKMEAALDGQDAATG
jgi:hypothetical protein